MVGLLRLFLKFFFKNHIFARAHIIRLGFEAWHAGVCTFFDAADVVEILLVQFVASVSEDNRQITFSHSPKLIL